MKDDALMLRKYINVNQNINPRLAVKGSKYTYVTSLEV